MTTLYIDFGRYWAIKRVIRGVPGGLGVLGWFSIFMKSRCTLSVWHAGRMSRSSLLCVCVCVCVRVCVCSACL